MAEVIAQLKTQIGQQVQASSLYQSAHTWFNALGARDQILVKGLATLVVLAFIISWTWQPSEKALKRAETRLASELTFHQTMKENAHLFATANPASGASFKGSILSLVNNTAKAKNIALKRFEPEGTRGLRIWLDQANFNSVIDWLELLETQKGITIEQISIDKVSPGRVNLRAVLKA
ncbi:MAG: type II secretion system protein M, partial [Bermanella sp.]